MFDLLLPNRRTHDMISASHEPVQVLLRAAIACLGDVVVALVSGASFPHLQDPRNYGISHKYK